MTALPVAGITYKHPIPVLLSLLPDSAYIACICKLHPQLLPLVYLMLLFDLLMPNNYKSAALVADSVLFVAIDAQTVIFDFAKGAAGVPHERPGF